MARGLAPATWTDGTLTAGTSTIRPVHVQELRTALAAVYVAAGLTPPTFTDPTLTVDTTTVKAVHLQELRTARLALSGSSSTVQQFYHLDAIGSVRAVTDATGAVVRRHDYTPFGEELSPVSVSTRGGSRAKSATRRPGSTTSARGTTRRGSGGSVVAIQSV